MSTRKHSAITRSMLGQSSSNVVNFNNSDLLFKRHGLLAMASSIEDRLEMFSDEDSTVEESESDDDDWKSCGDASDEELKDYAVDNNEIVEDGINIKVNTDLDHDPDAGVSQMTRRLNALSLPQKFIAPDGTEWAKEPFQTSERSSDNALNESYGPTNKQKNSRVNIFNLIFTKKMKSFIICHTNNKGLALAAIWNKKNPTRDQRRWKFIDEIEFTAFLAILLVMGTYKSNYEQLSDMWTRQANCIYRASMSRDRFKAILATIRFDDVNTRKARKMTNKAAAISELWLMMNENLKINYNPRSWITIAEQPFSFRGLLSFKQDIPTNPNKYGLKIFWAVDAITHYPLNGFIYLGQELKTELSRNISENVVLKLVEPYENSGRNITTDHFFTTLPLAEKLATRELTLIGSLRKDKHYIPQELMGKKEGIIDIPEFAFRENCTLVKYTTNENHNGILLSSMIVKSKVNADGKSQVILDYNRTKGSVDTMNQMVEAYSCKRKTSRWPFAMFFNMVDVMTLAAYLIYNETHYFDTTCRTTRRVFITRLASELAKPHIKRRASDPMVTRIPSVRSAIEDMLESNLSDCMPKFNPALAERDSSGRIKSQGKCYKCPKKSNTRKRCMACNKPVCNKHSQNIVECLSCASTSN